MEQPDPRGVSPQSAAFRLRSVLQLGGIVGWIQRVQFKRLILQQLFLIIVHGVLPVLDEKSRRRAALANDPNSQPKVP